MHIKINSLVELISEHNKEKYLEIINKYPDEEILKMGNMLGDNSVNIKAIGELTYNSLSVSNKSVKNTISKLKKKLDRARLIKLIGNIIGATSSAGLITAVLTNSTYIAVITASINFTASISILISNYIEKSIYGNKKDINDYLIYLMGCSLKSEELFLELNILLNTNTDEKKIISLVKKANQIVSEIKNAEVLIGK